MISRALLGTVAIAILSTFAVLSVAGKSYEDDRAVIHHNYPPIVEQQTNPAHCYDPDIWWDTTQCVTNTGPSVWDPDDRQQVSSWDGHVETTLFADWAGHSYFLTLTGHKRNDFWVDVKTDKPLDLVFHQDGVTGWRFEGITGEQRGATRYLRGCFHIELSRDPDNNNDWQTIPNQGGGGLVLGKAVPVTLTFTFPEGTALGVDKRAIERCR